MRVLLFLTALLALAAAAPSLSDDPPQDSDFSVPENFLWGAGVSAIQTEGAWNEDGKAESVADWVIHASGWKVNHDVAADSYHKYEDDVNAAAELKLKLYKLSMSWARLLPEADATKPNQKGVDFYKKLINKIIEKGMVPMVIMYHFDHPKILEDQFMGWQSPKMADKFAEYAKFLFETFGDQVKWWATINEPNMYCTYFNEMFVMYGLRTADQVDSVQCIHNNILAHMKARKVFKEGNHEGKLGFTALVMHARPSTTSPEDVYAAETFNLLSAGSTLNPVVYGDYPQEAKSLIGDKLPKFTEDESKALIGSADFLGLNVYFGMEAAYDRFMNSTPAGVTSMFLGDLMKYMSFIKIDLNGGQSNPLAAFTSIIPEVMKDALLWTYEKYKTPIVITENGFGDLMGLGIHDKKRSAYHSAFLRALVKTVKDYKVDVLAYSAWSLIDSFEFSAGFSRPFGLVQVDYAGKTLKRTIKESSKFWLELANTNVVPLVEDDSSTTAAPESTTAAPTPKPSSATVTRPIALLFMLALAALKL